MTRTPEVAARSEDSPVYVANVNAKAETADVRRAGAAVSARRTSVYLSSAGMAALESEPGDSLSGRINRVVAELDAILREATPSLTEAQWLLICELLEQAIVAGWCTSRSSSATVASMIASKLDGTAGRPGVNTAELASRIRGSSLATRAALVRIAMRTVLAPESDGFDRAELLADAGARIAGQGGAYD